MTVYQVHKPKKYIGFAADTKPIIAGPTTGLNDIIPAGSEFYELDTSRIYTWSSTDWIFTRTLVSTSS